MSIKEKIIKAGNYILHIFEGDDNRLSGKRVLGTICIISGLVTAWYGVIYRIDHLDSVTGLVLAILGAGLAFWGITTIASLKNAAMNSTTETTKTIDTTPPATVATKISTDTVKSNTTVNEELKDA